MKRCAHCRRELPLSSFHKNRRRVDGLHETCKECRKNESAAYYATHKQEISDKERQKRIDQREYISTKRKARYAANRERVLAQQKHKYVNDAAFRAKMLNRVHLWRKQYPDKKLINNHKRNARKRELPDTFTYAQWQRALDYFDHRCAVCGRPAGLWHTLAADHWIPLTDPRPDNPGTVASNIVPLCHSLQDGEYGCNNHKSNADPVKWLIAHCGKRKARAILARIEAYFKWIAEQDATH